MSREPIAGGQDLLTTRKDYITRPSRVVNLKALRTRTACDDGRVNVVLHTWLRDPGHRQSSRDIVSILGSWSRF